MSISKEGKEKIVSKFGSNPKDTGAPEVQCAILTERIKSLTEHLKINKKDFQTRRGLVAMVTLRKRLLSYLRKKSLDRYIKTCQDLGLRMSS